MGFVPTSQSLLLSKVDDYSDIYRWVLVRQLTSQSKFSSIGVYIFLSIRSVVHLDFIWKNT